MSPPSAPVSEAPRLLLVRTSALGDIVQALPVLVAVRRALPGATIAWVVDEAFEPLLQGHALLDRVIPAPLRRWRSSPGRSAGDLLAFVRELRSFAPDIALDLMGNHKGAFISLASGAKRRIGARRRDRREPASAIWINERVAMGGVHAVERMLSLLAPLGIEPGPVDFAPQAIACGRGAVVEGRYIYLHPGAAWGNKRLPPETWGAVAAELARRSGIEVRVGVAPGEEPLAERVVATSDRSASALAAPTLSALTGALRAATLVLAGDTGATHLARALGKRVVAVHGPTDPARHGPWNAAESVVVRRLPCSFCHQRMEEAKPCLLGILPEEIVDRALALLDGAAV